MYNSVDEMIWFVSVCVCVSNVILKDEMFDLRRFPCVWPGRVCTTGWVYKEMDMDRDFPFSHQYDMTCFLPWSTYIQAYENTRVWVKEEGVRRSSVGVNGCECDVLCLRCVWRGNVWMRCLEKWINAFGAYKNNNNNNKCIRTSMCGDDDEK